MSYSSYYQHCGMSPQQQQAMQMAAVGHLSASSPLNCSAGSNMQQSSMPVKSPVASPSPSQVSNNAMNHHHLHPALSNTPVSGCQTGGYHSPQHQLQDQQGGGSLLVPHPQMTPGGDDGISSDCSDDEGSPHDPSHMPVVYPWMKKIHVGGSGEFFCQKPWWLK